MYHRQDVLVQADKGRIIQIISNLLDNAIKFTKEGAIYISLERKDGSEDVLVSVKDPGQGINPEILPKLFTKFATKSESETGTGLGLFISKSIVEAHGGRIWAENNTDGKGATFAFSLSLFIQFFFYSAYQLLLSNWFCNKAINFYRRKQIP